MLLVSFKIIPSPSRRPYEPEASIPLCKKKGLYQIDIPP